MPLLLLGALLLPLGHLDLRLQQRVPFPQLALTLLMRQGLGG